MQDEDIIDISSKLPWQKSVGRRMFNDINYAIIHHDAVLTGETYDPVQKYTTEANYHIGKGWGHLAYHLRIARDGKVYQTIDFREIGYHAGNWTFNKTGIGICLDGDLTKQEPTKAQIQALHELMDYLATKRPDMPKLVRNSFYGHKEVRGIGFPGTKFFIPSPTACPSPKIAEIVKTYRLNK